MMVQGDGMADKFDADFFIYPKIRDDVPYNIPASMHGWAVAKGGDTEAGAKIINFLIGLPAQQRYAKLGVSTVIKGAVNEQTAASPIVPKYYALMDKVVGLNTEPNETMILETRKIVAALVDPAASVREIAEKLQKAKEEVYK